MITFNGKNYTTRELRLPEFGDVTVAGISLEQALLINDKYISQEARLIDEGIFFYVEDNLLDLKERELIAYVEKNCD